MPKKEGYLNEINYEPVTEKGKRLQNAFNMLEQKEKIFLKEKNALIKRKAVAQARRKLGLIRPVPIGKRFRSFMNSKIEFK